MGFCSLCSTFFCLRKAPQDVNWKMTTDWPRRSRKCATTQVFDPRHLDISVQNMCFVALRAMFLHEGSRLRVTGQNR